LFRRTAIGSSPRTQAAIIYLQKVFCPSICSVPSRRFPYQNLGFSLEGFTAFHSHHFWWDFVTVALSRILSHIRRRRLFSCRQPIKAALAYFFARHEHYGHLSTVRAWTFLYRFKDLQRLPER